MLAHILPSGHAGSHVSDHCPLGYLLFLMAQARKQTFEERGANLRVFTKRGANLKKILILRPKLGV